VAVPLALGLLAFAIRIPFLGQQSLWFDEAFTVLIAQFPTETAIEALFIDGVHPPLYYLLMRAVMLIGHQETMLRLPSVLFGAVTVPLLYLLVASEFGKRAGFLAGLLLLLSPFQIWHSRDARMYSMLAFLATLAMLAYIRMWKGRGRSWTVLFGLSSSLAYATHYYAFFLPLVQLVHFALHIKQKPKFIRSWLPVQILAAIPSLIWLALTLARQGRSFGIGWIPHPQIIDLLYSLINLTVGYAPSLDWTQMVSFSLALLGLSLGAFTLWKRADSGTIWVLWGFLPLLLVFALSLRRPVFVDRFLLLSLPALLSVVAVGIANLPRRIFSPVAIVLIGVLALRSYLYSQDSLHQREQWREASQLLQEATATETIVLRVLQIAVPFRYYSPGQVLQQSMEINREITPLPVLASGYAGLWFVYRNANVDIHLPAGNPPPFEVVDEGDTIAAQWIMGQGPPIVERFELKGITIFRFDLES
jgi:4-amino-4-deoxy-L-arabinose transferase-like glycosyltransferase